MRATLKQSWPQYALWVAALLSIVNAIRLLLWYWPGTLFEGHTSGVWAALAGDFSQGEFYRPVMDERGYGGTRYMPLFFLMHGWLVSLTGDLIGTGQLCVQLSALFIVSALAGLLWRQGLKPTLVIPLSLLFLGSFTYQRLSVQLRCDFLAAGAVLWSVLCLENYLARRRPLWLGGVIFWVVVAFFTKFTSLYILPWIVWRLWRSDLGREALGLIGAGCLAGGLGLALLQWASQGRFAENFSACVTGGSSLESLLKSFNTLYLNVCYEDPLTLILLLPTLPFALLSAIAWSPLKVSLSWERAGTPAQTYTLNLASPQHRGQSLLLLWSVGVTWFIFTSPGTWMNHLVDPIAAAILVLGVLFAHSPLTRTLAGITCLLVGAIHVVTWFPGAPSIQATVSQTGRLRRQALEDLNARFHFRGRTYLAENPSVPLALGERPFLMDEFSLRLFLQNNDAVAKDFERKIRRRYFDYIILESAAIRREIEGPEDPFLAFSQFEFWKSQPKEFRFLMPYYQLVAVRRPLAVLAPRPPVRR